MNEKTEMMASMIKNLALLLLEQNNELTMEQALSIGSIQKRIGK